ncbi:antibiotic biosynthesis monooxygenase [Listeria ilorinensis]|uniref:antibiotic biosynthesis monooxygenase n=1 Tax=Listeria ilorinensis TaxID=2867439 RepID=UPI001EF465FC|nr:antibiotic biosynthesis monooxygenase [Listeria ilorinensis]
MSFSEISIYQVKPAKTDEFEAVMEDAVRLMKAMDGCQLLRFMERTHYIKEMQTIKEGLPPDQLTRIVKCVRYAIYWEFDTSENYGKAQKQLYETYWKAIEKCLLVPHDKILGKRINENLGK